MISAIAAIGEKRELGGHNTLLWHIPGELKRFKEITMGHPIIMGRKTYESIGRLLPGRVNIIVTRQPLSFEFEKNDEQVHVVNSLEDAISAAKTSPGSEEIFIIGGGQIFKEAFSKIDRLYLTLVHKTFPEADTFFPEYSEFTKVIEETDMKGEEFDYTFKTLERPTEV